MQLQDHCAPRVRLPRQRLRQGGTQAPDVFRKSRSSMFSELGSGVLTPCHSEDALKVIYQVCILTPFPFPDILVPLCTSRDDIVHSWTWFADAALEYSGLLLPWPVYYTLASLFWHFLDSCRANELWTSFSRTKALLIRRCFLTLSCLNWRIDQL